MTLFDEPVPLTLQPVELEIRRACKFKAREKEEVTVNHRDGTSTTKMVQRMGCANCGGNKTGREHMGTPPSINVLGSGNPGHYISLKELWQTVLLELLRESGLPKPLSRVTAEGRLIFPDRRARDQGNYRVLLEKALGDALQEGGWLADDSWDFYEFGGLGYIYEKGVAATQIMLFPAA